MAITVIIPCHNMVNSLTRAVQSALEADRVIITDDASSDGGGALARQLAAKYQQVIALETNSVVPGGVCHARNLAISRADDDSLIIPLDADDMLLPNAVQTYAAAWQSGTCVYAGWLEFDSARDFSREVLPLPPEALDRQDIARGICFHRRDWLRAGGYNPLFNLGGEDYAFMLALRAAGVSMTRLEAILYQYDISPNTRAGAAHRRWPCIQVLIKETYEQPREAYPAPG